MPFPEDIPDLIKRLQSSVITCGILIFNMVSNNFRLTRGSYLMSRSCATIKNIGAMTKGLRSAVYTMFGHQYN